MFVRAQHINRVTVKGRTYFYHRVTGERLPDDPQAAAKRALEINAEAQSAGPPAAGTMADLVAHYRGAPAFTKRAEKTRKDYGRYLSFFEEKFGDLPVREIDREFVLELRDSHAETPRKADYLVQVLSVLLSFAVDRPKRYGLKAHPAQKPGRIYETEGYRAWPDNLIAAFRKQAYPELVRVMEMALYTGQRGEDCVAMLWSHYDGEWIDVAQEKGGERLGIHAHPDLRRVLSGVKRSQAVILTTRTGRPWKLDHLRHEIHETVTACGFEGYSLHGLRKRAAKNLAEAGCSEKELQAILGHKTLAMVQHYTREADQRRLSKSAIRKLVRHKRRPDFAKSADRSAKQRKKS